MTHILVSFTYKSDPTHLCKLDIPSWNLVVFLANIRTIRKWKKKKKKKEKKEKEKKKNNNNNNGKRRIKKKDEKKKKKNSNFFWENWMHKN